MQFILEEDSITIAYDPENNILYCTWRGFQSFATIKPAGDLILQQVREKRGVKILNDNTDVVGHWSDSTEWTQKFWFPAIWQAGVKKFAWVYPEDYFAKISVKAIKPHPSIKFFENLEDARNWLLTNG
jgi:hypothetical protein